MVFIRINNFFIDISHFPKNNPNTIMHGKWNEFFIFILYSGFKTYLHMQRDLTQKKPWKKKKYLKNVYQDMNEQIKFVWVLLESNLNVTIVVGKTFHLSTLSSTQFDDLDDRWTKEPLNGEIKINRGIVTKIVNCETKVWLILVLIIEKQGLKLMFDLEYD